VRGWLVLAVLLATVLGFIGSTLYSQRVAAKLDDAAISIATNASPAIEHLTAARGELVGITVAAASAVQRPGAAADFQPMRLRAALLRLHEEMSAYLQLPFYPRERRRYAELEGAIRALEGPVSDLSAAVAAGDDRLARTTLERVLPAAARVDRTIEELVAFNAEQQHRLALEIPRRRELANRIGYALQLSTAALGLILMALVIRGLRQYGRLLETRRQLAAARATDAATFGARLESIIGSSVNIAEAITTAGESNPVLQIIADEARILIGARYCAVGCGTDPARPFDPWVSSGMPAAAVAVLGRPPRPDGLLGAVTRQERPIRLSDPASHASFRGLPPGHPPVGAFLGVPIVRDGENRGNLFLARAPGEAPFTDEDERAAALLAGYLGVAISNFQLYRRAVAATQARDDLLATVSHDLKNPLNAISLSTDLLRLPLKEGKAAHIATRIDKSVARMARLIEDLLDAAKIEAGALRAAREPEQAASLIDSALEMFQAIAAEKTIRLIAERPAHPAVVSCERHLILRVLANLIGNAIKFSPAGSSIAVAADPLPDHIQFSVRDSGPGIPAEHLAHAFERYWQQSDGDRRGSGLGLYIAKGIVDAHGGRIWIESAPGKGTSVHFTLPLEDSSASSDISHPAGATAP
jgi:signal transduction histidine kinase